MKARLLLIFVLALACFLAGQFWTLWVQSELMTDLALRQMERDGEAARVMQTANQAQQGPALAAAFLLAVTLVVLWRDRRRQLR